MSSPTVAESHGEIGDVQYHNARAQPDQVMAASVKANECLPYSCVLPLPFVLASSHVDVMLPFRQLSDSLCHRPRSTRHHAKVGLCFLGCNATNKPRGEVTKLMLHYRGGAPAEPFLHFCHLASPGAYLGLKGLTKPSCPAICHMYFAVGP